MPLDERKYRILKAIIDDYILTATPVGSRTLSRKTEIGLSSATIRNEMSDLEEMGYLEQPHTSAGRVPSLLAFRLYVDQLMRVAALGKEESDYIRTRLTQRMGVLEETLATAAQVLSEVTDYAGAALTPQAKQLRFKHVQLVPLTDTTALLVLVTDAGVFKDSVLRVPEQVTPDMLQMISNALSKALKDRTADDIPHAVKQIASALRSHGDLALDAVSAISGSIHREANQLMLGGRTNLLKHPEYADIGQVRAVLNALEPHGTLAQLMSQRAQMEFSISIGPELGSADMQNCSLVTVSYHVGDAKIGSVGVVGPVRMDYARVVSVLTQMQKALNEMLNQP